MFNFLIKKKIAENLSSYEKIVIWGSGGLGKLAINNWLPQEKIEYIVGSSIKNTQNVSDKYKGYSPKKILNSQPDLIIICSSAYIEIFEFLKKNNIKCKYYYIYELFLLKHNYDNELSNLYIDLIATKNCNIFKLLLVKPQVIVNITYRLSKYLKKYKLLLFLYWVFSFVHYVACMVLSIQLPLDVEAGPGLIFAHPGTIIFTKRAKLGSFVTIYHCCTIGTTLRGGSPILKDFVIVYTGSHVLGGSILESHSRVGAMSLLLDFKGKKFSTIAGIPAKIKRKFLV